MSSELKSTSSERTDGFHKRQGRISRRGWFMAVLVSSKMKPHTYKRRHADVGKPCSISLMHSILSYRWLIHSFLLYCLVQMNFSICFLEGDSK